MSQILRYRQYWMATLKVRHACIECGELAIYAKYSFPLNGTIEGVSWYCHEHVGNPIEH
jgi:hypothetical protein